MPYDTKNNQTLTKEQMLLIVADHIEAHPEHFDMSVWTPEESQCGTAQCIAGWVVSLFCTEEDYVYLADAPESIDVELIAREKLDMTAMEAARLFMGDWSQRRLSVEAREAVNYLRKTYGD